jgi:hypothetical protein
MKKCDKCGRVHNVVLNHWTKERLCPPTHMYVLSGTMRGVYKLRQNEHDLPLYYRRTDVVSNRS